MRLRELREGAPRSRPGDGVVGRARHLRRRLLAARGSLQGPARHGRVTHRPDLGRAPRRPARSRSRSSCSASRAPGCAASSACTSELAAAASGARFGGVIYVTATPDIADGIRRAAARRRPQRAAAHAALLHRDRRADPRRRRPPRPPASEPDIGDAAMIARPASVRALLRGRDDRRGGRRCLPGVVAAAAHDDLDPQRLPRRRRRRGRSTSPPSRPARPWSLLVVTSR